MEGAAKIGVFNYFVKVRGGVIQPSIGRRASLQLNAGNCYIQERFLDESPRLD
jgi:hypothetical protein